MLPSLPPGASTTSSGASAPGILRQMSVHFALSNGSGPGKISIMGRCVCHARRAAVSKAEREGSGGLLGLMVTVGGSELAMPGAGVAGEAGAEGEEIAGGWLEVVAG